jgi:hypothetical protein
VEKKQRERRWEKKVGSDIKFKLGAVCVEAGRTCGPRATAGVRTRLVRVHAPAYDTIIHPVETCCHAYSCVEQ